jgi:hypothetical protein
MQNSDIPYIKMAAVQSSIFIDVNSLLSLYNFFIRQCSEMPEEEKMELGLTQENLEGRIAAFEHAKRQLKAQVNSFAIETELDMLGLGKGNTQVYKLGDEPPKII